MVIGDLSFPLTIFYLSIIVIFWVLGTGHDGGTLLTGPIWPNSSPRQVIFPVTIIYGRLPGIRGLVYMLTCGMWHTSVYPMVRFTLPIQSIITLPIQSIIPWGIIPYSVKPVQKIYHLTTPLLRYCIHLITSLRIFFVTQTVHFHVLTRNLRK